MPLLASPGFKISFEEAVKAESASLPESLRPAAGLIRQWLTGENHFELKTSGSTGEPKSFQLLRNRIIHSARLTQEAMGLQKGDWILNSLSTEHVAGFMMTMRALVCDFNLFVVPPSSNPLQQVPEEQRIDFASFVPMQMQEMLDAGQQFRLEKMKAILLGGGTVSAALEKRIQELAVPVYQGYGMTETYSHIALRRLNGNGASSRYKALPGVNLSLDERGCLRINSEVTGNAWLTTNDLAELYASGEFAWLGRIDNVINSGGIKVRAEKVETEIAMAFAESGKETASFFITAIPDDKLGEKVVLVIEDKAWDTEGQKEFLSKLSGFLSAYEMPRAIYFVDRFDRTTLGKIDKKKVMAKLFSNENQ